MGTVASSPVAMIACVLPSGVDGGDLLSLVVTSVSIASSLYSKESYTIRVYIIIRGIVNCSHDLLVVVLLTDQASV